MTDEKDPDPTEEVGPEECDAKAGETEIPPAAVDEREDHPRFLEEVDAAYEPEPEVWARSPVDGLPSPMGEGADLATAPPFTIDHVICVEDDRSYVEVFRDELEWSTVDFPSGGNSGGRYRYEKTGKVLERKSFAPDRVQAIWGGLFVQLTRDEMEELFPQSGTPALLLVRPVRPRCIHYKRQVFSNDGEPDPNAPGHRIVFRNCMVRRSVGGAFMSLRDEAVYACDYRVPAHAESVNKYLDEPDARHLRSGAHKVQLPLWGGK